MDAFIAKVQAWLTFLIVGAWIALKIADALGYAAGGAMSDDMKEVVMLAVGFWLLRPRASSGASNAMADKDRTDGVVT